ncbi:MAG: DUF1643 domain-containing protein [Mycolicibacterium sp.]|uniref:DUF1643 domain-containing protein n=1 Tax=Mycolicibacterium sp. TaxID=2320850 RepID=UPI003D10384F
MTLPLDLHLHHRPWAVFSHDRRYRYKLTRDWNAELPRMGIVGHNPSTAGEHRNDRTVCRLIDFAKRFGHGGFDLYNLYAGVSTDPKLLNLLRDPIGPDNDDHLAQLADEHDFILLAWGGYADPHRARTVTARLWHAVEPRGGTLATLGWTSSNQPRHPLYLASTTALQSLTATPHHDYADIDDRWSQLIADTDLDAPTHVRRAG